MPGTRNPQVVAGVVLIASLLAVYALWYQAQRSAEAGLQADFDFFAHEIITHIQQRMAAYQQVLHGVRALFLSSDGVTREEFHTYTSSLLLDEQYPGIQGLSHVLLVPHAQKDRHIAAIRKQGFPDYTIHPAGERAQYAPVVYIESLTGRNVKALGYDAFEETKRRAAMVRARDYDRAALTGKLTLLQEPDEHAQAGFLMLLPLFAKGLPHSSVAERRVAVYGWVTAVIRMSDLMAGIAHAPAAGLDFAIYDGETLSNQTRMYVSDSSPDKPGPDHAFYRSIQPVVVADRTWSVVIRSSPLFEARHSNNMPAFVALIGAAFSLLLTMLAYAHARAKNVTRELGASEARWRYALEGAGEGVWDWNIQTDELKCSSRWKEMLGYAEEDIGNHFSECLKRIHPDDLERVKADLQAHLDGKDHAYSNEHRVQQKDGGWRWILDRGKIISRTEDGKPLRMMGTHADITERKLAEAELREQRELNDAVVEAAGNIIVVLDRSGRFVYFNRATEEITGYRREELLGQPVWDWVIPEEQQAGVKRVFEHLKAGNLLPASRYENDWQKRDGSRITLDWHNTVLRNTDDEITHIVALGYDVTEHKKSEKNIQRLSRLYATLSQCDQAIVHSSSEDELFPKVCRDAVVHGGFKMAWIGLVDEAGQRVRPVAAYGECTEYLDDIEISVASDRPSGTGPTGTAIRENHPVWCQDCQNDPRSRPWHEHCIQYALHASAALPISTNGTVIGAFNLYAGEVDAFDRDARELLEQMASDVSFALDTFAREKCRKEAEDELNRLNTSLEARVRERTNELKQAKEMADAASQAKSDFLSNMSHEIRTPLTAIIGFSEALLANDFEEPERKRLIATIVRNGKHLQQIINDILDLSKIEANVVVHELVDTSLFAAVGEVQSLLGPGARERGLEFRTNYHFPLPALILSNPTYLKQILINLCSNAIKFTREGYVHVDISCDKTCRIVRLDVIDSGIGMTREEVAQIFEPFTQADATTTRKYGGTGLGLSISTKLASILGGKLTCVSQPGRGSHFTLTIANQSKDIRLVYSLDDVNTHHHAPYEPATIIPLTGNILLVEDNLDNQELIAMYARRFGLKIDVAENGREGVDMALANNYGLILMDMQMPVLDGVQAISRLRNSGYTRPIVSLTANAMSSTREQCIAAGANDYLVKPIDLMLFYETLKKHLPQAGTADDSGPKSGKREGDIHADFHNSPEYLAIAERYKQNLPNLVAELAGAVRNKDWGLVQSRSHDLKGTGGTMGFPEITELARRMNIQVINREYDRVALTSAELERFCQSVLQHDNQETFE